MRDTIRYTLDTWQILSKVEHVRVCTVHYTAAFKRQPVTAARRAARHLVVCAAPYMRRLGMCLR